MAEQEEGGGGKNRVIVFRYFRLSKDSEKKRMQ